MFTLHKTALAIAITAASSQVLAETIDVSSSGPFLRGATTLAATELVGTTNHTFATDSQDFAVFVRTTINGELTNSADITAQGNHVFALSLDQVTATTLINNNRLAVIGASGNALNVEDVRFSADMQNNGQLLVTGADAVGVDFLWSQLPAFINSGTISAEGSQAIGIKVEDSLFADTTNVHETGLINTGTIRGTDTAISIGNQPRQLGALQINQKAGLIEGGTTAIKAQNNATLNWTGGTIRGNLDGLFSINVEGDVRFDGALMRTHNVGLLDISSGTLTLVKPHTQLESDLYLSGSGQGALEMLLGSSTVASQPVLNVTGSAEFGNGSQIKLTPRPNDFASSAPATNYLLVRTGGSIDNQGLSVQSTSALLEVKSFNVSSNTVEALVAAKSDQGVIDTVKTGGGNQSAQRAQVAFTNSVLSKLDPNDPVYKAFANATSNEQVAMLAKQLAPQTNGGSTQGARSALGATTGAIGGRSSAGRGAATGDVLQEKGLWLQALHSDADQDMRDGIAGYDADSKGIAIGADGKLNEQTTLGLAYSYLDTDVRSDDGNKTQVDSHALTAYASWQDGPWFVDGSLTYGVNDNESKRYVAGTEAKGDYDSDLVGVNALAGYVYRLNDSVLLEPRVAARYSNVDIDSYREKGSAAALDVGAARFEVGELGAGVRMAGAFALGQGTLEPEAKLMAYHDVIGDKTDSTSSFTLGGTPFVTNGASPVRDSYEAGVGVTYKLGALSVGASYDYLGKTDFNADTFNAKVRYDF